MIPYHRQANQHKRRTQALIHNPIAQAVFNAAEQRRERAHQHAHELAKATASAEFEDQVRTTRIKLLLAEDGSDATELLASLAVVIGTPCEAGAHEFGRAVPWVRQLHGALRTIQAMCLAGYRWDSRAALAIDRAIELAIQHQDTLQDEIFTSAWLASNGFAGAILRHEVQHDTVSA